MQREYYLFDFITVHCKLHCIYIVISGPLSSTRFVVVVMKKIGKQRMYKETVEKNKGQRYSGEKRVNKNYATIMRGNLLYNLSSQAVIWVDKVDDDTDTLRWLSSCG